MPIKLQADRHQGGGGGGGGAKAPAEGAEAPAAQNQNPSTRKKLTRVLAKWLTTHCPLAKKKLGSTLGVKENQCIIPPVSIEAWGGKSLGKLTLTPQETFASLVSRIKENPNVKRIAKKRELRLFIPQSKTEVIELTPDTVAPPFEKIIIAFWENKIALGGFHSCLLRSGKVYCWGQAKNHQLGRWHNRQPYYTEPHRVEGLTSATDLSLGESHTCAIQKGLVYCWGSNSRSQLSRGAFRGSAPPEFRPVAIKGLENATKVKLGPSSSCATAGGRLYCWGDNTFNQIGPDSSSSAFKAIPQIIPTLTNVTDFSLSEAHSCAIQEGEAYCWGLNFSGELGFPRSTLAGGNRKTSPVKVAGLRKVSAISLGYRYSCALREGQVLCWGEKIGHAPTLIQGLDSVTELKVNGTNACALQRGKAFCWNILDATHRAKEIAGLSNVDSIAVGANGFFCASKGKDVYCWGKNSVGQLGRPVTGYGIMPIEKVEGLE